MATGKQAYFCGKPNPLMMRTGLKMLNCHSAEAVMVGDRMDTDVISGMESGMSTVLVLSGAVHQPFHGFHEAALDPRCAVRASSVRAGMVAVLRTAGAARLRSQERGTRHGRQLFFADESALGG